MTLTAGQMTEAASYVEAARVAGPLGLRADVGAYNLAACLAAVGDPAQRTEMALTATHGVDHLIQMYGPGQYLDDSGNWLQAMFFGTQLGEALLVLRKAGLLTADQDARWTDQLEKISAFWVAKHDPTWYTNGNIELGETLLYALTAQATKSVYWDGMWRRGLAYAISPGARWPGCGLVQTSADAGYLVETGAGGAGFDTDYTTVQASFCARLWFFTRDLGALRLLDLLWGTLGPLTDAQGMTDMTVGVRKPHPGQRWVLAACSIPVRAVGPFPAQSVLDQLTPWWANALGGYYADYLKYPVQREMLGENLGTALLAATGWTS